VKKIVIIFLVMFLLVGCSSSNSNISKDFKEQAVDIAEMFKEINENGFGAVPLEEADKYKEFVRYEKNNERELTNEEAAIMNEITVLAEFLFDGYKGDESFEEVYDRVMDQLK
jgi:hypothetical protein